MSHYSWATCPALVKSQIHNLQTHLQTLLTTRLVGCYLHGSLAMGCFNPTHGDLDLLIVTTQGLSVEIKQEIIAYLLQNSLAPCPIEISFLVESAMHPFQHPLPYDLHYSEAWRTRYQAALADSSWIQWNEQHYDSDLSTHITVILARGITLYGKAAQEALPTVPASAYARAIVGDFDDAYEGRASMPIYFILNACRVYAYLCEGAVFSKAEGAKWALQAMPIHFHSIIIQALEGYLGVHEHIFDNDALNIFAVYMREKIHNLASDVEA